MAQTGYTPILIYSSSTASQAPSASNLTNSTLGSELAINITDGKLFYKDNGGSVQVIAWKVTPTSAGGTGLTSYTAGDLLYYATGTTLSKLGIGSSGYWLGSSGTAPQWNAPAALTKTDDTNVTLTLGGSASTALLNAASLTLGWTGQLAVNRGGTGLSTLTAGYIPYGNGTSAFGSSANLFWNTSTNTLQIPYIGVNTTQQSGYYAAINGDIWVGNTGGVQIGSIKNSGGWFDFQGSANVNGAQISTATNLPVRVVINGTETWRFDTSQNITQQVASKGINFTANTAAAGMTSQLLNWYEEGTWTPVLYSGATDATMSGNTSGRYTRIGRVVHIHLYIQTTNLNGIGGGTLAIKGLPFTVNSGYAGYAAATVGYAGNLEITAGQSVALRPNAAATTLGVLIWNATTGTADMAGTEWTNTGYVSASFSYMI